MTRHLLATSLWILLVLTMMACGGGGGGKTPPPVTPPTPPQSQIGITTSTLPGGVSGIAYSATLNATGGTQPYKWVAVNGDLPYGLTLSQDGLLTGTLPITTGGTSQSIAFRVTDSSATPLTALRYLTLDILGFNPTALSYAQIGQDYVSKGLFSATGGTEPLHWSTSGTLPPGISLVQVAGTTNTRSCYLGGKPTQTGTYPFSISVTDSSSPARTLTVSYSLDVEPAELKFRETQLPIAVVGQPYSYTVPLSGGQGPFSLRLEGQRPAWLNFDVATGTLSGTPTTPGYASFGITVSDNSKPVLQSTNWESFWLLVVPAPLTQHNDSIATAVPIFPGNYEASISPYRDSAGNVSPDQDYYQMTSPAGSILRVSISNQVNRYGVGLRTSPLDPVLEIVDANGQRLGSCNDPLDDNPSATVIPPDPTPTAFDDPCMNWTSDGENFGTGAGAQLTFKVPGDSGNFTYYLHVFDWRGDARPDMSYTMTVIQQ